MVAAAPYVAETVDLIAAAEAVHATRRANSGLVASSTARFEQIQALKTQGKGIKPIMRGTRLAKETVRKFYRATSVEEVTATSRAGRPSMLDEFKSYLHERFNSGITNASALFREIREQGYRRLTRKGPIRSRKVGQIQENPGKHTQGAQRRSGVEVQPE